MTHRPTTAKSNQADRSRSHRCRARRGLTLLEMIVASTMIATLMTSIGVVLRTSRTAWQVRNDDIKASESLHSAVRHVLRNVRQCQAVTSVSSTSLSLLSASGTTQTYTYVSNGQRIDFAETYGADTLVDNIQSCTFTALMADGVTAPTDMDDTALIKITVTGASPRAGLASRTVTTNAWVRSW